MLEMNKENVLRPVDINSPGTARSPARKRARYASPGKEESNSCTVKVVDEHKSNETDVERDFHSDCEPTASNLGARPTTTKSSSKRVKTEDEVEESKAAQIALLQASLTKDTLKKLTLGEWDDFLVKKDDQPTESMNYFDLLSDEMVLHIFQFLPRIALPKIALVCRRWNRLTLDESLWARMDLSSRIIPPGALGHILNRQVLLLRLAQSEIQDPPCLTDSKCQDPSFKVRTVFLDMSMVHCSLSTVAWIFSKCYRLKKVSLENVSVDDDVIGKLCCSKDLEVINLAMAKGITVEGIKVMMQNCRNIRQLNLAWTGLNSIAISHLCKNLPDTLDRINLSGCRKSVTDKDVLELVTCCPKLRELDLSDCTGLTGDAIQHILLLEQLNFLALSRCYLIPSRSLLQLKKIPTLMYLDIHGGYIEPSELRMIQDTLGSKVTLNKFKFSSVARPTVGPKHEYIWNMRVKYS